MKSERDGGNEGKEEEEKDNKKRRERKGIKEQAMKMYEIKREEGRMEDAVKRRT